MTQINDQTWPVLIATMVEVKSRLSEVDGGFWPYHLPEVAATDNEISRVNDALGRALPLSYRSFLEHANGWQAFFHTIDLLSCEQLTAGIHRDRCEKILGALEREDWLNLRLERESTLVIGVSLEEIDVFVIDCSRETGDHEAPVVWIGGERVDEWPTFFEFFSSMIEYNQREIQHFT